MVNAKKSIKQKGQALVEYAFLLVLVCSVLLATLALVGPSIGNVFSSIYSNMSTASATSPTATPESHHPAPVSPSMP